MKLLALPLALLASTLGLLAETQPAVVKGYVLEHEKDLATSQPGPHDGGGTTTAHNFFATVSDCKMIFRKRVLHPGSAIGSHLQKEDEIYYVLRGAGIMEMNGSVLHLRAGDAVLTRPGSTHSLKPEGNEDIVILISYLKR